MTKTPERTDVAIIGAGPAGLFAVFECGMMNMRCHVIDVLEAVGGQCQALYPDKPIFDIPGHTRILASDLVMKLEQQAAPFDPAYHLGQQVVKLAQREQGRWLLETSRDILIDAQVVFVAAGVGAFGPKRPPLQGIERFEGKGIHYLVKNREGFRGKKVVIAGGGDSAVDWAISLSELAAKVSVVHRRTKFRAAPASAEKLQKLADVGAVDLVIPFQLAAIEGDGDSLKAIIVHDLDGNERRLEADALLSFFGLSQNLGPIADWELNLNDSLIAVNPGTSATNKPGIFAIGDIATYPGKVKLILSGFAEAAQAAHAAHSLVHPDEELHFEHSSIKGVPGNRLK
ncbi:MAG TPA: NAD(P)/FAD-dependent oxidoreductase [Rhodospirillales bacterium]|jgi:thioredoxin reductase (NADPH)|nr:NAD(P)/FAD-dependent oxidoreductase [Rhodospirillales bacterium]